MLRDLTFLEYSEWKEVYRQQPFGVLRDELNTSKIAQAAWTYLLGRVPALDELAYKAADPLKEEAELKAIENFLENAQPIQI